VCVCVCVCVCFCVDLLMCVCFCVELWRKQTTKTFFVRFVDQEGYDRHKKLILRFALEEKSRLYRGYSILIAHEYSEIVSK
jgi:hypothetical protein